MTLTKHSSLVALTLALFLAVPALGDDINEPWQSRREAANKVVDKACAGDANAVRDVWRKVKVENDPVYQSNITWLSANCATFNVSKEEQAKWLRKAAEADYPIAQANYGNYLLRTGKLNKVAAPATVMLLAALEGGYANAAAALSAHYSTGTAGRQDIRLAKQYYNLAKLRGADTNQLAFAKKLLLENGGSLSASSKTSSSGTCYVALQHNCSVKSSDVYVGSTTVIYAARRTPQIKFAGCKNSVGDVWSHKNDGIVAGGDNKKIPAKASQEIEAMLRNFKGAVVGHHNACGKQSWTDAKLFATADDAYRHLKSTVDLSNTSSFESSWLN